MTSIEWTQRPGTRGETWNPIAGCSIVSPGCTHCYAMRQAQRIQAMGGKGAETYAGTTRVVNGNPVWTGKVNTAPEAKLLKPLSWREPRTVFVNSMSDLFHESVPDEVIDRIFAVMALTPQHTYQVLTKRSARLRAYMSDADVQNRISAALGNMLDGQWIWGAGARIRDRIEHLIEVFLGEGTDEHGNIVYHDDPWPLPNVWLGVSAERQQEADERVPDLLATPAAIRFVSAEPQLGPIDFRQLAQPNEGFGPYWIDGLIAGAAGWYSDESATVPTDADPLAATGLPALDWIIVGGESGPGARPMHPAWVRSIRDQCAAAGTAFFFKQWGEWAPGECAQHAQTRTERVAWYIGDRWREGTISPAAGDELHRDDEPDVWHLGKSRAGRLLDGAEHSAWPAAALSSPPSIGGEVARPQGETERGSTR